MTWRQLALIDRIRWLRYLLPPLLAVWVVAYQLAIAQPVEATYGHLVHYGVEIAFYSLAGPVVTWLTLVWVERNVREKELLEAQVRRVARERAAVLEEERARIARDLHDGVAQTLYFLALKTDALRKQAEATPTMADELREMGRTARGVIRDVRRTIFALHPLDWPPGAFRPALRDFVTGFAEQVGWQTTISFDAALAIPLALEPVLFRLVQESLNNVAKHAEATHVTVSLAASDGGHALRLTVRDDGQGFDARAARKVGLGLKQMAARVEGAGGVFHLASEPGAGTTVTAQIPLESSRVI